ncbi:phBC6A51 family helix-turn-helix protein [Paenibacillus solisilvae]|uniref:PhBC6A51 family helix-turn-helix protein n=1 Tax=Paenibacillus solisilvae TaxID=2486751 RepID=A0ABW0W2H2_9BACL
MSRRRKALEAQLTPQQRKAASLIVDNEWGEVLNEDGKKKTGQELADEIGIARSTLYEWKSQEAFNDYVNYLTDLNLEAMRTEANIALMKLIRGGNNGVPSVKALDLYYRRHGLLTNVSVIEDRREPDESKRKTDDEVRDDIAALDALVNGTTKE